MDLDMIRENIKMLLKEARYQHSLGVEEVACDLALIHGYNMEKASVAGILHDCAKNMTDQQLVMECEKNHIPISDIERKCGFLLHGKVGAILANEMFGIEDKEILDAITYHTTGRPGMTLLEKIIFTADYIEPYRRPLPRINEIRENAYSNLDLAIYMILENTLYYLVDSGTSIDHTTIETYKYYGSVIQTH